MYAALQVVNERPDLIRALARVKEVEVGMHLAETILETVEGVKSDTALFLAGGLSHRLTLPSLLDVSAERARLEKEIADAEQYLARIDAKLSNEQFRSKAPANVVAAEEERRAAAQSRIEGLRRALGELG
jgi:valyl-tRNA synthetase